MTEPVIIRKSYPPKHRCKLPGFFRRLKLGLRAGAQVVCTGCEQVWEWKAVGWLDPYYEWVKVD